MAIQLNIASQGLSGSSGNTGFSTRSTRPAESISDAKSAASAQAPESAEVSQQAAAAEEVEAHRLDHAVQTLSEKLPLNPNELQFSVDEESGRMIVTVIDPQTEEVIRQLPPEEALQLARTLSELNATDAPTAAAGLLVNSEA